MNRDDFRTHEADELAGMRFVARFAMVLLLIAAAAVIAGGILL